MSRAVLGHLPGGLCTTKPVPCPHVGSKALAPTDGSHSGWPCWERKYEHMRALPQTRPEA